MAARKLDAHATGHAARMAAAALMVSSFVWGVSWWPFRYLHGHGLHPLWTTGLTYLAVTVGLLALNFKAVRELAACPPLWLMGLAAGVTNVCFNWAVTVGDVVRVVLLFYLMPAWSVLVAWWLLDEKPTLASLLRLLLAMAGVLVVLKTPESAWPLPQGIADWLAIGGGLSFALTNSLLRKYGHTSSGSRMLAMFGIGGLLASVGALVGMSLHMVAAPALELAGLPVLVVVGLALAFVASNAALQYGVARLAAGTTAIVMLTEILFASVSSAAMGAAEFTPRIVLGGGLIVLAAVLAAMAPAAAASKRAASGAQ